MSRTHTARSETTQQAAVGTEDWGRLLLRIALGGVLFAHGLQKFTVMGVGQVGEFFASLGLPAPELAASLVSTLELVGGIALILGVLVRPIAVLAAAELLVASLTAHDGFYADAGGWELPGVIALSLGALAVLGTGRITVLAPISRRIPPLLR